MTACVQAHKRRGSTTSVLVCQNNSIFEREQGEAHLLIQQAVHKSRILVVEKPIRQDSRVLQNLWRSCLAFPA